MGIRLMKGNDAVVFGALMGGCTHFFGYPITPASEIAQQAAYWFPLAGRHFLQAESEVSVINMLYGASSAGARVMTASSGPGIALMGEGLSYMAGACLPAVVVDMQRSGPGLGNIWPEQSDYNMVVKGGGHGDYRTIVLAPYSAQEMFEMTMKSFEIADRYRMTVFILSDAYIGQMMEQVSIKGIPSESGKKDWAVYADAQSRSNLITSIYMNIEKQSEHNRKLQKTYEKASRELLEFEHVATEDAQVVFVAYGICARICLSAVRSLRRLGLKVGLFRPKTLWPLPEQEIKQFAAAKKTLVVVELSSGMLASDISLYANGATEVLHIGSFGGATPTVTSLVDRIIEHIGDRHA